MKNTKTQSDEKTIDLMKYFTIVFAFTLFSLTFAASPDDCFSEEREAAVKSRGEGGAASEFEIEIAEPVQLTASDKNYLLGLARKALAGEVKDEAAAVKSAPASLKRPRKLETFVTIYKHGLRAIVLAAMEVPIANAVIQSARKISERPGFQKMGYGKLDAIRIKIDVVTKRWPMRPHPSRAERVVSRSGVPKPKIEIEPGIDGIMVVSRRRRGHLLPSDVVTKELLDPEEMLELACINAGLVPSAWEARSTKVLKFHTISFIEDKPNGGCVDLYRGAPLFKLEDVTLESVRAGAKAGGDWLIRSLREEGAFYYIYYALRDRYEVEDYSITRHAGAVYSLFELCGATKGDRVLEAAKRSCKFMVDQIIPGGDGKFLYLWSPDKAKLGASALAVIALLEMREVTGSTARDRMIKGLGSFLVFMQKGNGDFCTRYFYLDGDRDSQFVSRYYPGEATLALVRLYKATKNDKWLNAALKAAHYLIFERANDLGLEEVPQDQWLAMALSELYPISKGKAHADSRAHADYCFKIADVMIEHQHKSTTTLDKDFAGASDNSTPPRVTPTATNCEALVAAWRLAKYMGRPADAYREAALLSARFQLQHQFDPINSYYLPAPKKACGGFRAGVIGNSIRIDFVQHDISSLLGVAEMLAGE